LISPLEMGAVPEEVKMYVQYNVGVRYLKGLGVSAEVSTAHMWASIASTGGCPDVEDFRTQIQGSLNYSQMVEGWQRGETCVASNFRDCD